MKSTFLLLNNVISILVLFKILTYYIDDKKILEIRKKTIFLQSFAEIAFLQILKSDIFFRLD